MTIPVKTIEAVYEEGRLRPLEPLEERPGLVYLVTVVDVAAIGQKPVSIGSLRGKYKGLLSSSEEFSRQKQTEKTLER